MCRCRREFGIEYMRILAVIPARAGSKGVPGKNVKRIKNVPLIAFSVWTALRSGLFDDVLLSTDDPSYFDVLRDMPVRRDYIRPPELASDTSPTVDALQHALRWFEDRNKVYDAVMLLQPPAPFRTVSHLKQAVQLMRNNPDATCVTGTVRLWDHHPARIKKLVDERWLVDFCAGAPEKEPSRRQDLAPPAYLRNGSIYLSRVDVIRERGLVWGDRVIGMEMPEPNSVNIDQHIDFITAESMLDYEPYRPYLSEFDDLVRMYNE